MKIILYTSWSDREWPEEVKNLYDVDHISRVDQKVAELIKKRMPRTDENEDYLLREYAANVAPGGLDLTDRETLAEFIKGAKRYIGNEFCKYNSFNIKTVPDEATYVAVHENDEGFEYPVYILDGQLYYDGEPLANCLQNGYKGGKR